jgi:hypothetical protein
MNLTTTRKSTSPGLYGGVSIKPSGGPHDTTTTQCNKKQEKIKLKSKKK